jgi:hypothetical protein
MAKILFPKHLLQAITVIAALLFVGDSTRATTAVMLTNAQLTTSSRVILLGDVQSVKSQWDDTDQNIYSYVKIHVSRILKGHLRAEQIVVKQLGGTVGDDSAVVFGAPDFRAGQRVLLFLNTSSDGTLRTAHLFMGKYDIVDDKAGRSHVQRTVDGDAVQLLRRESSGDETNTADLASFIRKIKKILRTRATDVADYERLQSDVPIVEVPPEYIDEPAGAPGSGEMTPQYTFLNNGFRWFEPDSGQPVFFFVNPNAAPTGDGGISEVNQALAAWTNIGPSSIGIFNGGTTGATGLNADFVSAVSFNDPRNQLDNPVGCGGILAASQIVRSSSQTAFIRGIAFRRILESDVVFNNGWNVPGCSPFTDPTNVTEVATHELGHSIGFGHSNISEASMRAFIYFNGRGSHLGMDDVTGAVFVYPQPGNPIDDSQFFVGWHYRDFLNREPDLPGWDFWTGNITPCGGDPECTGNKRVDVSRAFWYSPEFLNAHPGLRNPPGVTPDFDNREFVRLCYVVYLRRDPDLPGWDFWTDQLNNDTAIDPSGNGYNHLIRAFLVSPEYLNRNFVSFGIGQ